MTLDDVRKFRYELASRIDGWKEEIDPANPDTELFKHIDANPQDGSPVSPTFNLDDGSVAVITAANRILHAYPGADGWTVDVL